jgi:biotin carboxyl carrier protein
MYKVSVDEQPEIEITMVNGKYAINNLPSNFDIVTNSDGSFHVLYNGKSHHILVNESHEDTLKLEINKRKTETRIKNELEDLLTKMGMDKVSGSAMNELKAPMPGMVLKIHIQVGDQVKKGDSLLVLEAMKMENNIKALGDGIVSAIQIQAGDKVEKNQVMIQF